MLANGEAPGIGGIIGLLGAAGGWAALRLRLNDGGAEPTKSAWVGIAGGIPGGRRGGRLPAGRVPGEAPPPGALDPGSSGSAGANGLGAVVGSPWGCAWPKGDCRGSGATPCGRRALVWLAIMLGSLPRGSCTIRGSWGDTGPWNSAGQARNTSNNGTASWPLEMADSRASGAIEMGWSGIAPFARATSGGS